MSAAGVHAQTSSAPYYYRHRLAPPFESHTLGLTLSRLDDEDAGNLLYGLAALLSTVVALGLVALYRMVATQVRFSERRNNFVSAVSHELKTPLTAIRMYGEMLQEGMVDSDATRREYYGIITAEAERLTRLINNVMEHAQLQEGRRLMHNTRGDVGALVREVVEIMLLHIQREGFEVQVEVPEGLPSVCVDPDAFKQVLFNILDNALKYGRHEAPTPGAAIGRLVVACRI